MPLTLRIIKVNVTLYSIWGSVSGGYEKYYLLAYKCRAVRWKSTAISEEHVVSIFMVED
jgi:hypothetical protein